MEIEVMVPSTHLDDSASTTPYISASSSPQRYGLFFLSAPTSPARVSAAAEVPFSWEERPGTPKSRNQTNDDDDDDDEEDDFAFDFSGQLERSSFSAADELFDGGKIRPLKPPPRLQYSDADHKPFDSPRSPTRRRFKQTFSPRKKKEFDPFAAAIQHTARTENPLPGNNSRPKKTRSLSVPDLVFDREKSNQEATKTTTSSYSLCSVSSSISLWYRKWKLKDLFLFRSASEGRASSKDQLNKFLKKARKEEDLKTSSFRSTASSVASSSVSGPLMKKRDISAHELHYTLNKAFSEEMKRKTFLPYKKLGVLGCLGFIPSMDDTSFRGVAPSVSMTRRQ